MKTGRVDYAPDYKSDQERWDAGCEKWGMVPFGAAVNAALKEGHFVDAAMRVADRNLAHTYLERKVIEATKTHRAATLTYNSNTTIANWEAINAAREARDRAVDALIEFEAQEKK